MEFISNIQAFGGWWKKTQGVGDGVNLLQFSEKSPWSRTPIKDNEKIRISEDKNHGVNFQKN